MWSPEIEPEWQRLSAQVLTEMQAWRDAHPAATLRAIAQEVDARLSAARARLVAATALAGSAGDPVPGGAPRCPACGETMAVEGMRTRRLVTAHNAAVALTRRYARCPRCGTGVFPPG